MKRINKQIGKDTEKTPSDFLKTGLFLRLLNGRNFVQILHNQCHKGKEIEIHGSAKC